MSNGSGQSAETNGSTNVAPVFRTDPAEWMQYVYKEVCVTTMDNDIHAGWVYTIDPISQTIVLVQFRTGDADTLKLVMGHAVKSIVVLNENTETHKEVLDAMFVPKIDRTLSPEQLKEKREELRIWLSKNRIPVQVSKENSEILTVSNALSIHPPYGVANCESTNEIILGRIQGLIKSMPDDVKEW